MSPQFAFLFLLHTCHSLNEYIKEIGPNGEDIWRSHSDFIPIQSQSYGTLRLGHIMSVEFDFIWGGRQKKRNRGYECFFRVGYNASIGTDCDGEGARYPSFWLTDTSDTMHVSVSSGAFCQSGQSLSEYGIISTATTYHIQISFNNTAVEVHVSEPDHDSSIWHKSWQRERTPKQYIGDYLPVWFMSNKHDSPLYIPANGTFFNILMKSSTFTTEPTTDPTTDPTISAPSFTPTTRKPNTAIPTFTPTIDKQYIYKDALSVNVTSPAHITAVIVLNVIVIAVLCCIIIGIALLVKNKTITIHKPSNEHASYQNYHYDPQKQTDLVCEMKVNRHEYVPTLTSIETAHVIGNLHHGHEYVPTFTATEAAMAEFTSEMRRELYGIQAPVSVPTDTFAIKADAANPYTGIAGFLPVSQNNEYKLTAGRSVSPENGHEAHNSINTNIYKEYLHDAEEREAILEKSSSGSRIFMEKNDEDEDENESVYDTSDDDVVTSNKYANLEKKAAFSGDGRVFTFKETAVDPNVAKSEFERQYVSPRYSQVSEDMQIVSVANKAVIGDMLNEDADEDYICQPPNAFVHPQSPYQYNYAPEQDVPILLQQEEDDNPSTDLDDVDVDSKHNESVDLDASSSHCSSGLDNIHVSIADKQKENIDIYSENSDDVDNSVMFGLVNDGDIDNDTITTAISGVISINT